MEVRFYHFSKKPNSTKIPTDGGTVYSCTLKSASGIINPIVRLMLPIGSNPSAFNYAYIPDYGRYYYVRDWVFSDRLWEGLLQVDALASWKNAIGSSTLYALRSSAKSDGNLLDHFYPTSSDFTENIQNVNSPFSTNGTIDISKGCFCVGVISSDPSVGSIKYSFLQTGALKTLCSGLMAAIGTGNGFDADDASLALQKSVIDPLSYIKSCVWLPISYSSIAEVGEQSLTVGDWIITANNKPLVSGSGAPYYVGTSTFNLHVHPQTSSRGNYLNLSPYRYLRLSIPPFGVFSLEPMDFLNADAITLQSYVDYCTGAGELYILNGQRVTQRVSSMIGVPIQLSEIRQNILGGGLSTLGSIVGSVASGLIGNAAGAITGVLSGIGSAVDTFRPTPSSIGSNGSFVSLNGQWQLYERFSKIVDEDNGHHGRPLCQIVKPAEVGGYLLVADGDVDLPASAAEISDIKSALESGFFYE